MAHKKHTYFVKVIGIQILLRRNSALLSITAHKWSKKSNADIQYDPLLTMPQRISGKLSVLFNLSISLLIPGGRNITKGPIKKDVDKSGSVSILGCNFPLNAGWIELKNTYPRKIGISPEI